MNINCIKNYVDFVNHIKDKISLNSECTYLYFSSYSGEKYTIFIDDVQYGDKIRYSFDSSKIKTMYHVDEYYGEKFNEEKHTYCDLKYVGRTDLERKGYVNFVKFIKTNFKKIN